DIAIFGICSSQSVMAGWLAGLILSLTADFAEKEL
ncbi:hypothetical protein A2U01_0088998, partial [Trifolium medium]|nr:hypothetical protein [Trifolium medium]